MKKVTLDGKDYPCYQTMGAMRRFRKATGQEISDVNVTEVSKMVDYMYYCTVSACAVEKVEFPYSDEEFADRITVETMQQWSQSITDGQQDAESSEKKS
jgi:hypothetical protein